MRSKSNVRIRLIWFVLLCVAAVYIGRLWWLQVVEAKDYRSEAARQYSALSQVVFNRGSIYMTERSGKEVTAATLATGFTLVVNPTLVKDPNLLYTRLSSVLKLDKARFLSQASKKGDTHEEILKRVSEADGEKIRALKLDGVTLLPEKWRFYPGGNLSSHVLGFVGYQGESLAGQYGLERYYDHVLDRSKDGASGSNIFAELFRDADNADVRSNFEGDIITTIEPNIELALEATVRKVMLEYSSDSTGGVVINPKTGAIYAMAALPDFDPNHFSKEKGTRVFSNPVVESVYEMGSIVKPLTMAAGLDAERVTAKTTYDDKGFLMINNARIANFDGRGRGVVTMQEVLNQSLNTGAAFVERKLGNGLFAEYMRKFGLGEETGIDLPGETHGLLKNLESPRDIEYATASYGQGIALTPIETVRALSAIANGGYLVTPHVVQSVRYSVGVTRTVAPDARKRILRPETSEEISRMLVEVYDTALLEGKVKMDDYSIAAKTGTAQIPAPGGGYYEDRYLHSFFGYFPAYDPQFLIFLYTIHPRGVQYASQTLTHPFVDLAKTIISYYNLPPDR